MQWACAILSSVAWPALQYFSTLSHIWHDLRGGGELLNSKCVFWFFLQLLSVTFLVLRRNERDTIKMYIGLHATRPFSCQIIIKLEFSGQNFEKYSNIKLHKNLSTGCRVVPCGRADGRTDVTKVTVPFRNFANALKKESPVIFA
jgi:hypothetical protein